MDSKVCKTCGIEKKLSEFSKEKRGYLGVRAVCKECRKIYRDNYAMSIDGVLSIIYKDQVKSSKKHKFKTPTYTRVEFVERLRCDKSFLELHEKWVGSGFIKDLKPSCDRIDDYIGYNFYNIQWLTWKENREKYFYNAKNGINTKECVSVLKVDKNFNVVKRYYSIQQASRENNISASTIVGCCKGKNGSCGGFYWCYEHEFDLEKFNKIKIIKPNMSGCVQLDTNNNVIRVYNKISDVKDYGFNSGSVANACRLKKTLYGYNWFYRNEYNEMVGV